MTAVVMAVVFVTEILRQLVKCRQGILDQQPLVGVLDQQINEFLSIELWTDYYEPITDLLLRDVLESLMDD